MEIEQHTQSIREGVQQIIENARTKVAVFLNAETTLLYWQIIGDYINQQLLNGDRARYGAKIVATLSQQLTIKNGRGCSYSALTRMCKVAMAFDADIVATLSQQLSWSHLIELAAIENKAKRDFFTQLGINERWGIRELRKKVDTMHFERISKSARPETIKKALENFAQEKILTPELVFKNSYVLDFLHLPSGYSEEELENALVNNLQEFILELGNGSAFLERQKRIPVDTIDYRLDLLFYHRKLKRLVAIDLKIGKFKPKYKSQMELYLRWLQKYEMQEGEEKPIGLLLCSEGNTEHIELLMLDEKEIRVAQYLTELPSKEWFADRLHRALEMAKMNSHDKQDKEKL